MDARSAHGVGYVQTYSPRDGYRLGRDGRAALVTVEGAAVDPAGLVGQVLASPLRRGEPVTGARLVGPGLWGLVPDGLVATPVRLTDLAVARLLRAGDRVDVLATGPGAGQAGTLATGVRVLAAGGTGDDSTAGLLLVAVDTATAARLAAAATTATLTVSLPPP